MAWLCLVRWKNLLLIVLGQILILHCIYNATLHQLNILLYIGYTLCIAAAGNIINDCFDITTDKINKPTKIIIDKKIERKKAINVYYFLNFIGLCINTLSLYIYQNFELFIIINLMMVSLYFYSSYFKGKPFIGNLIIALLTGLSTLLITCIVNGTAVENNIVYILSFFAFVLNLSREITKDIEDIKGDKAAKLTTLPIILGIERTLHIIKYIIYVTILSLCIILFIIQSYYLKTYIILFLISPLFYCLYLLKNNNKKNSITIISTILKLIIGFGIFTVLFL